MFQYKLSILFLLAFLCFTAGAMAAEIHDAATGGDVEAVQKQLDSNPQLLNAANDQGRTPLHLASLNGRRDVVELLLGRGAEVNRAENTYQ